MSRMQANNLNSTTFDNQLMELPAASSVGERVSPKQKRPPKSSFNKRATRMIRVAMAQRDLSFKDLARMMEQSNPGSGHTAESLTTRVNRGTFTVAFLIELSDALRTELQLVAR